MPLGLASVGVWWLNHKPAVPDPADSGTGATARIALFDDDGRRLQTVQVKKLVRTAEEWRKQLGPEAFSVTRRQATEFAFQNRYCNNHRVGLYRCVCCGNALFRSGDKFDSDTGWPSFSEPIAAENISTKPDRSVSELRIEVLCAKCDAHLGHVFDDGPPPSHNRYCLNSAALRFVEAKAS